MPPSDFLSEASPASATDPIPPMPAALPSANGEEEAALARLEDDGGPAPPTGESPAPPAALSLEQRVQVLERTVALLEGRRTAAAAAPPPTAIRIDLDKRPTATAAPAAAAAPMPNIAHPSTRGSLIWLLWDTWAEVRAIVRMFVDPRYQLPWSARVLPLVLLAAILTTKYWVPFSWIPFLGDWLLVKLVDLLLAFFLFKWLGHEARRYRRTSPDLPANLRL